MIVYGTCVGGAGERYESITLPSIRRVAATDDVVLRRPGDAGIAVVYNAFIAEALALPDLEALVLLHDDVEIIDPSFRAKVLSYVAANAAGVIGVVGGAGLHGLAWWTAERTVGRVFETRRPIDFGARRGEVDAVDGLLMVIAPAALRQVAFDERSFPRFHGYDVDYCLAVRKAALNVRVAPLDVVHRTKTGYGAKDEFDRADRILRDKWPQYVRPVGVAERFAGNVAGARRKAGRAVVKARQRFLVDGGSPTANSGTDDTRLEAAAEARIRAEALSLHLPAGAVLEVGSGSGCFLVAAERQGFDALGIERDPSRATAAQSAGLDVHVGDLNDWVQHHQGQVVDAIVCWSAEELLDDLQELRTAASLLRTGGMIVLEAAGELGSVGARRAVLGQVGLEVLLAVEFSSDHYLSPENRLAHRNRALLARKPWPVLDRLRIVARRAGASKAVDPTAQLSQDRCLGDVEHPLESRPR